MHNNGDGTFAETVVIDPVVSGLILSHDIDDDGDDDFVASNQWWLNDGFGNFSEGPEFLEGWIPPGWSQEHCR